MALEHLEGTEYGPFALAISRAKVADYVAATRDDPARWTTKECRGDHHVGVEDDPHFEARTSAITRSTSSGVTPAASAAS